MAMDGFKTFKATLGLNLEEVNGKSSVVIVCRKQWMDLQVQKEKMKESKKEGKNGGMFVTCRCVVGK